MIKKKEKKKENSPRHTIITLPQKFHTDKDTFKKVEKKHLPQKFAFYESWSI
jgi:hypothetical protein